MWLRYLAILKTKIAIKLIQNSTTLTISSCRMHIRLRNFHQERKLSLKWRCDSYLDDLNLMRLTVIIQHAPLQCTPQLRLGQMSTQTKLLKMTLVMLFKHSTIPTYRYTDGYTRVADNDTRDSIQGLNYSNIHTPQINKFFGTRIIPGSYSVD